MRGSGRTTLFSWQRSSSAWHRETGARVALHSSVSCLAGAVLEALPAEFRRPTDMRSLLIAVAAATATDLAVMSGDPPPHLRPKPPYRAWAFYAGDKSSSATAVQNLPPTLYPGANLDLTPPGNISAVQEENRRGIAALHWAYGPDSPWAPKLLNSSATNQSAAAEYFKGYTSPLESSEHGTWAFAGAAIDEWNPSSCPSTFCNNSAAAAAGYTMGKQTWPWTFTAAWVTGQDEMFTSLMLERTFDLAIIEGCECKSHSSFPACGCCVQPGCLAVAAVDVLCAWLNGWQTRTTRKAVVPVGGAAFSTGWPTHERQDTAIGPLFATG